MSKDLSDVLSEFAQTLVTDLPIQAILDHLVLRLVEVFPVRAAGVSLSSQSDGVHYLASSGEVALWFERLQTDLSEGPSLVVRRTGAVVAVPDLRDDARFPNFGPQAVEAGINAVFSFPLGRAGGAVGALDLYCEQLGPLDVETMVAVQTLSKVATAYLLNAEARVKRQAASDRFRDRSLHDPLTGLANQVLLRERLQHAVQRARRSKRTAAILFADLDRFKEVNDLYGHRVGDELLVAVAGRLTGLLRPGDTLARMSGDEFVILCEDLDQPSRAEVLANRIAAAMEKPFLVSEIELHVTASVGIAFAGPGDDMAERILDSADVAMYEAKRRGGGHHQVVDLRKNSHADERADLGTELLWATVRDQLRLDYQPIVRTSDGVVTGVEALLRWAHPQHGVLMPEVVVPLAEQTGSITEIGAWVLNQACQDRSRWRNARQLAGFGITVNISATQLTSPNFYGTVEYALESSGNDADALTLDITETAFVEDPGRALVVLKRLKALGVGIALDDFGTGYSSINHLRRFPIDTVKVDRRVIADLAHDRSAAAISAAIVNLAHDIDLLVVAEGVESADQCREASILGCDLAQGYYYAKPAPADELWAQIQQNADDDRPGRYATDAF